MMQAKAGEPAAANARARQGGRTYGLAPVLPGLALAGIHLEGRGVVRVGEEDALCHVPGTVKFPLLRELNSLHDEVVLLDRICRHLPREAEKSAVRKGEKRRA